MSWIIQAPSDKLKNRSMYFVGTFDEEYAIFSHDIAEAKEFEKEEGKKFIVENDLEHCHLIPS